MAAKAIEVLPEQASLCGMPRRSNFSIGWCWKVLICCAIVIGGNTLWCRDSCHVAVCHWDLSGGVAVVIGEACPVGAAVPLGLVGRTWHITSYHVTLCIMVCRVASRHVASCQVMSCHVTTSCHVTASWHVVSCHVMSCHAMPCRVVSSVCWHGVTGHVTSWHVASCIASRSIA